MTIDRFSYLLRCGFLLSLIVSRIYIDKFQTQFESADKNIHRIKYSVNFD